MRRAFATPDRRLLENCILPHYAAACRPQAVLFVGTRWYTQWYEDIFDGHLYRTIDIDRRAARFGSRQGHVVGCATRTATHFPPASFDVVVVNGVFGWGLDQRPQVEAAVRGFFAVLKDGGELVIGWNDVVGRRPLPFADIIVAHGFVPVPFEPLGRHLIEVPGGNRHRYQFFRKPARIAAPARPPRAQPAPAPEAADAESR